MSATAPAPSVVVVGSANQDIVVPVTRHPGLGETVLGGDHLRAGGGKGANQAVACARLGADTSFVGCVGDDDIGRALLRGLEVEGIDTRASHVLADTPSGIALIVVAEDGENTIVVSPGANAKLTPEHLPIDAIGRADALLVQLEVPVPAIEAAVAAARGLVVCNPAPAAPLPATLLAATDILVPNRSELAALAGGGQEPVTIDEVVDLARTLEGPGAIVVTLGVDGALVLADGDVHHVPAHRVVAIDATAAGDSFCGALTVARAAGADLVAATRQAVAAAAITVTRRGAQPSLPTRAEVTASEAAHDAANAGGAPAPPAPRS